MRIARRPVRFIAASIILAAFSPTSSIADEGTRLNNFFEKVYQRNIERSPIAQSRRGIRRDQDKWDDISEARQVEDHALTLADLKQLREYDFEKLNAQDRLSYRFFEWSSESDIESFDYRQNAYLVTQMGGMHTRVATTLINNHPIETHKDAEDYISRLRGVRPLMAQLVAELEKQEAAGVQPPQFVYPKIIDAAENLISGEPFDRESAESPLWADFRRKVEEAGLEESDSLLSEARTVLLEEFQGGYKTLVGHLEKAMTTADQRDGAWKLPNGEAYYRFLLRSYTTEDRDPDELHELGLNEVERIHAEMRAIMRKTGFDGDLMSFFDFMRTDKQFYYSDSADGRRAYVADAERLLEAIDGRADEIIGVKPKAGVVVKPVEAWREKTAAKAFYDSPPQDGSRPGIFYINLYDMGAAPKYELPVLLYHETIPGHHVETVVAYELKDLPKFRKFASISAFSEGWSLYSEVLPKEIGLYEDPYDDFGRLSLSLLRAARLVVDTGIHAKKWAREEAVAYMDRNMPSSHYDNQREIDRYTVWPGQATTYYVGMQKILFLRGKARKALGDAFDIRTFHDVVLGDGPLPLPLLEKNVDDYINATLNGD